MALSMIFSALGGKRKGKIGELELDVTLTEKHEFSNEITSFPVEAGAEIADHVIQAPSRITIQGFVTNTPVKLFGGALDPTDYVQTALETLLTLAGHIKGDEGLYTTPEPVTVVTGLNVYSNMMITSLTIPRDRTTGQALEFTAELVEVIYADSETVSIPADNVDPASADLAQSAQDAGQQVPAPPAAEVQTQTSILANLIPGGN